VTKDPSTPQTSPPGSAGVPAPGGGASAGAGPGWPPAEGFIGQPADTRSGGTGTSAANPTVELLPETPAGSVGAAEPASLGRLLAYVWPAVALGRLGGVFTPLLFALQSSVRQLASGFGLFSAAGVALAGAAGAANPPGALGDGSGQSSQGRGGPSLEALPSGGTGLLTVMLTVLLGVVGALAVARLLVGEELFSPRRWRGHRG
jgi:hypothetical protein